MEIFHSICDLKTRLERFSRKSSSLGFVPTMGFLHEGHLSLVRRSVKENIVTVVSIFVNPTQFAPNEDFDSYPRDFHRDETLLREEDVDFIFYPSIQEMYPDGFSTKISVSGMTQYLCGYARPTHFDGVTTVVAKLLNIVSPRNAYFGLKDYQQFMVVSKMVRDLNMPYNIVGVPIMREHDGLAMSSRNVFLKPEERDSALSLYRSFDLVKKLLNAGEKEPKNVIEKVKQFVSSHPYTKIDYVSLADPDTLADVENLSQPFLCALAVKVGEARLIDNMIITL